MIVHLMKTPNTYVILVIAVAAVSSGLTFQAIGMVEDAPVGTTDESGISGHITATLYDDDGYIKAYRQTDNRIVDRGLDIIGDLVFGLSLVTGESIIDAMAVGTGTTSSAVGDVDLETRAGLGGACANQTAAFSQGDSGTGHINVTASSSFQGSAGCDGAITEAGLFDTLAGAPTGNLFARQAFSVINVGTSDQLDITWTIQIDDDGTGG